ncbi:DUF805 domain-containing protein [Kocuria sp. CH-021]|uniref:DUF805 domain-containing protein n=1 Tax=Kocuria sp. CH-021 TaxID=3406735 RepID=UPI003C7132FA
MPIPYRGAIGGPSRGVGCVEALKFFFTRYAQFTGRSPRSEYWWPVLFFVVTTLALTLLGLSLGTQPTSGTGDALTLNDFGILILLVLAVMIHGTIVSCIAVAVRRLHYAGLPGWFYLAIFLPYVGNVAFIGIDLLPPKLEGARLNR